MIRSKGLGRGLDALLAGTSDDAPARETLQTLAVDRLRPGKYQPRTQMDEASLAELADSIREQGVMQPILVRPVGAGSYEIVAGERRWRAARLAGLAEVPALVREIPDRSALALALIVNIQREDLDPLEEAQGLARLIDEFGLTHEAAAKAVGRSRSAVTNLLRLTALPKPVQEYLHARALEMGHARALLALPAAEQARWPRAWSKQGCRCARRSGWCTGSPTPGGRTRAIVASATPTRCGWKRRWPSGWARRSASSRRATAAAAW
jgi:ParB family chromosome partitioning protein